MLIIISFTYCNKTVAKSQFAIADYPLINKYNKNLTNN